ncbi:MAG: hypothetical protein ACRBB6_14615 [Neptuniibacter sp.]
MNIQFKAVVFSLLFAPVMATAADVSAEDFISGKNFYNESGSTMTMHKMDSTEGMTKMDGMEQINTEIQQEPTAARGEMVEEGSSYIDEIHNNW